jgi:hypothetical protein
MSRQVLEQIAAEIAGHGRKHRGADPARHAPKQIVRGDQDGEKEESPPDHRSGIGAGEDIHQRLDRVLRADRAGHRREDRKQDEKMG